VDQRIAVAAWNLGSGFTGLMFAKLKKLARPGQTIVECATAGMPKEHEFVRARLLGLLEANPRPVALIGICIGVAAPTLEAFRSAGVPVVLIDEESEGATTVTSDNVAGGRMAIEHLLANGRSAVAVVAGQLEANGGYSSRLRVEGARRALAARGKALPPERLVEVVTYSTRDGQNAMAQLLEHGREVDAVFCAAGDGCAVGLLSAARERKLKIPGQVAVLGYDDLPLGAISDPPLSTVRQPLDEIAAEAWRLATEETREILARPKRVLFEPRLVRRGSA
jgi:DNA-binding LacI/PurR family transcriptional regulator